MPGSLSWWSVAIAWVVASKTSVWLDGLRNVSCTKPPAVTSLDPAATVTRSPAAPGAPLGGGTSVVCAVAGLNTMYSVGPPSTPGGDVLKTTWPFTTSAVCGTTERSVRYHRRLCAS
jgi:hypothetical protein